MRQRRRPGFAKEAIEAGARRAFGVGARSEHAHAAGKLAADADNLVLRAARQLRDLAGLSAGAAIRLTKTLPVGLADSYASMRLEVASAYTLVFFVMIIPLLVAMQLFAEKEQQR